MKDQAPSSDPLPNPRHEAFAQKVASGRNATQAYMNVYGTKNRPSGLPQSRDRAASTGGHRLLPRKCVAARIKAIQQAGAAGVALELREIHEFLTRVVRTPAGQVTPSSDLCTRVKQTRHGATDVWMPDKLACIRLSAKLQGFLDIAKKTTQSDPPEEEEAADDPTNVTEEYRAILIAQKRADSLEKIRLAEEARLAEEQRIAEERRIIEEKYFRESPTPPVRPPATAGPVPTPAIAEPVPPGPPAWVGPSGRQPYFGMNFEKRPTPYADPNQPAPSFHRVTPEIFSEKVSNSHHPTEPTEGPQPEAPKRGALSFGGTAEEPETRAEALRDAQGAMGANQKPETRQLQDRMSREAAVRTRLTGDGCTSDALLVL